MFIPPHSINLKDIKISQIRLGIQGYPGTGKTWSALTAPNPIIANFDNKITAHMGKDIPLLQFCDSKFLETECGVKSNNGLVGHLGLVNWLKKYGEKLDPDQTLIIDSLSSVINNFDDWWNKNIQYDKKGEEKTWAPHKAKIAYMSELCSWFKYLKCHIILTTHESPERDDENRLTGKVRPLLSGQFADQLGGQFTDWYRQVAIPKINKQRNEANVVNGKKLENDLNYFWQVKTDSICNCCCSLPDVKVDFVKPDFKHVFIDRKYNEV